MPQASFSQIGQVLELVVRILILNLSSVLFYLFVATGFARFAELKLYVTQVYDSVFDVARNLPSVA